MIRVDGIDGAGVPADDRGLAYGDGVFETLAVRDGRALGVDAHLARLSRGCDVLGFRAPDDAVLTAEIEALARGTARAVLRLTVTRGSGGRGYLPPSPATPRLIAARHPWPAGVDELRRDGAAVCTLAARLAACPRLAGIKHLNRLEQVLAARELARDAPRAAEGLLRDGDGRVVGGIMSNVFLVVGGRLVTPSLERCGVGGIIRASIVALGAAGSLPRTDVRDVVAADLEVATEMFLCNSVRGAWPAATLDGRPLPAPGPITRTVQGALAAAGLIA